MSPARPLRHWFASLVLFAVVLATTTAAEAAPRGNATFRGVASNSANVTLSTTVDGLLTTLQFQEVGGETARCTGNGVASYRHGLSGDDNVFGGLTTIPDGTLGARGAIGYYGDGGAVAGAYSVTTISGPCGRIRSSYAAVDPDSVNAPGPGLSPRTIYGGSAFGFVENSSRGSVAVDANPAGTGIARVTIAYSEDGCTYTIDFTAIDLTAAKYFQVGVRTVADAAANNPRSASITGVTRGMNRLAGGFTHPGYGDCPPVAGYWSATALPLTGLLRPSITGSIPVAGGIGLVVFNGGTSGQLVAASGCPAATDAFWADDGAGGFVTYVPGAAVAVVNAAWESKFATGIPAGTPLIGRCR